MRTKIKLIEKQPEIAENVDNLYGNGKRFAGVVLSTGGGKSFIAMDQIIKTMNLYNERTNFNESGDSLVLSKCPILYFSPTNVVNNQFKTHIAKYIIAPEYLAQEKEIYSEITKENSEKILYNVLNKLGIKLKDEEKEAINDELLTSILNNTNNVSIEKLVLEVLRNVLEKCSTDQKNNIVKSAFPNLNFKAYKNLEKVKDDDPDEIIDEDELENVDDINKINPELIIFDEAHRTGADTWWKKVQKYLERNNQAKVLAITATPERDVDKMNMMKELSGVKGMGYTTAERRKEEYLAGNYPLLEAIKQGMVTPPEVVHFDMTLDESSEFKKLLNEYVYARANLQKKPSGNESAHNKVSEAERKLKQALILIMKNPFEDDLEETKKKIEGEYNNQHSTSKKGLIDNLAKKIIDYTKNNLSSSNIDPKSSEIQQLTDYCYNFIQNYQWENGKSWKQVKKERVSKLIEDKLVENGLEHGKALTFIESMENGTYSEKDSKETKRKKAKEYIQKCIEDIRNRVGKIGGEEPDVTAIHSAAYTNKENNNILNSFMSKPNNEGPLKIIASVQKFNEGFHPDGISAEFMLKEIGENKDKDEPRIVLLQQLRKSYFS